MRRTLARIAAALCAALAVFFLLPVFGGILHFGMLWPAAALLLALCMTMLLAACGEDPNDEEKLSVVMTGAVRTMDPAQAVTPAERRRLSLTSSS
mgnify:CR=1 FL=1